MSWRSEGIKYRKNEVFLDVIESVNLLVSIFSLSYEKMIIFCTEIFVFNRIFAGGPDGGCRRKFRNFRASPKEN